MNFAPVAFFVYNRPSHTERTLEALAKNLHSDATDLIVFSDGPRSESDAEYVNSVRRYVREIKGFRSLRIVENQFNIGLAGSIINGVTTVCAEYGSVIVLEDDLVTSPFFLDYMNKALTLYRNQNDVISIHGYIYPVNGALPETFFLRGADCWGWATWKRGWDCFEPDGQRLLEQLENKALVKDFNFEGSYDYMGMLRDQILGKNNSWAIRWYASAFLQGKLTLYPGKSLVHNIGNDGSGTHCGSTTAFSVNVADNPINVEGIRIAESRQGRKLIANYFRSIRPKWFGKIGSKFGRFFKRSRQ